MPPSPRPPKVAKLTIVNNRLVCNYIEPRAIVAEYDGDADATR